MYYKQDSNSYPVCNCIYLRLLQSNIAAMAVEVAKYKKIPNPVRIKNAPIGEDDTEKAKKLLPELVS